MAERAFAGLPAHLPKDIGVSRSDLAAAGRPRLSDAFTIYGPEAYTRFWGDGSWR